MEFLSVKIGVDVYDACESNGNYTYRSSYENPKFFIIDKDLSNIVNFEEKEFDPGKKCKILFDKKSPFPTSILKNLSSNVNKITQLDKADYIVTEDPKNCSFGVLRKQNDRIYREKISIYESGTTKDKLQKLFNTWKEHREPAEDIYYFITFDNIEKFYQYKDIIDKIITTKTFCNYIYKEKEKPSKEEFDSILGLINTKNLENIKLAMKLATYYRLEEEIPFLIKALRLYFEHKNILAINKFNALEKFFFYRIGYTPMEIFKSFYYVELSLKNYLQDFKYPLSTEQKRLLLDPYKTIRREYSNIAWFENMDNMIISFVPRENKEPYVPNDNPTLEYIRVKALTEIELATDRWLDFFEVIPKIEYK